MSTAYSFSTIGVNTYFAIVLEFKLVVGAKVFYHVCDNEGMYAELSATL